MTRKKKTPVIEKKCPFCGKTFFTYNNNQFYDSSSCKRLIKIRWITRPFGVQIFQSKMNKD